MYVMFGLVRSRGHPSIMSQIMKRVPLAAALSDAKVSQGKVLTPLGAEQTPQGSHTVCLVWVPRSSLS